MIPDHVVFRIYTFSSALNIVHLLPRMLKTGHKLYTASIRKPVMMNRPLSPCSFCSCTPFFPAARDSQNTWSYGRDLVCVPLTLQSRLARCHNTTKAPSSRRHDGVVCHPLPGFCARENTAHPDREDVPLYNTGENLLAAVDQNINLLPWHGSLTDSHWQIHQGPLLQHRQNVLAAMLLYKMLNSCCYSVNI